MEHDGDENKMKSVPAGKEREKGREEKERKSEKERMGFFLEGRAGKRVISAKMR
jgi:hypothetical protein